MYRFALIFLALAVQARADYPARVVGVSDGDTLTVLADGNRQVKIRLNGVDAPETGQDFGSRAKQAASELAFGKIVTISPRDTDRYGRTVAEVILPDGRSLNREMVRSGLAWWYRQYAPADRQLAALESEAKGAHRGLWAQPNPVAPWEWRHGQAPVSDGVMGNRKSRLYHSPRCRGAASMLPANRVKFGSAAEAERAGYHKAKDCKQCSLAQWR